MNLDAMALQLVQAIGFRNIMMIFGGLGIIMLLWLSFSLPGSRSFRNLVRLFCLAGLVGLVIMIPLRMRMPMPTLLIRAICFTISTTILLIFIQLVRAVLLVPGIVLAVVTRIPLKILVSSWLSLLVALGGISLGAVAFWNAIRVPLVREVRIPIADLPSSLEGYHIVQLSDLHVGTIYDREWLEAVVEKTNALHPDLVAVTGDVGEFGPDTIRDTLEPLAELDAWDGVYYALGNHETYQGMAAWMEFNRGLGVFLQNERVILAKDGAPLVIAGLDDALPDPQKALAQLPDNAVKIVLAHRPGLAPSIAAAGADLQLAGHTHGGLMPGLRNIVAQGNGGFISGLYKVGDMILYVSNGTGMWTYIALRLDTPSEITSLRLVRMADPAPIF